MRSWLRALFAGRPGWMNALMLFCAYMAFVYVPWDLFWKPVARDQEVWFGILFTGWTAKLLTPLHWAVYGLGLYGFKKMRPWMHPWAALYVAQIAFGMLVWNWVYLGGFGGFAAGLVSGGLFAWLARALWRARPLFQGDAGGAVGSSAHPSLRERYGEWAVVTGASAGIGVAFARALAAEGLSCVLTARREERLRALADELEKTFSVATRCVALDLGEPGGAEKLADAVADLEVGVLVANAGAGYAGRFAGQETGRLRAMVELNCVAPVVLASRLLPGMRARGRGAIVVTGSVAGRQPLPLHGVYSATKAFDLLFGESLHVELAEEGVDVLVVEPGLTETEFHDVAGEVPATGQTPEEVVEVALDALGRQPSVVSGWLNWVRANAARLVPRALMAYAARDVIASRIPEEKR